MKRAALAVLLVIVSAGVVWLGWEHWRGGEAKGAPNVVRVVGERGAWSLEVNGRPFEIRGVGCGVAIGKKGEDFLLMARDMGVNCVRTWGTDQGTHAYLDRAHQLGLLVDAGIWINWEDPKIGMTYLKDNRHLRARRKEALDYVRRFKNHPAVLMWNVGNEAFFHSKSDEEKAAMSVWLEELVRDIKRIDPNHPVMTTEADAGALAYLRRIPSLDLIGVNTYGSVRSVHGRWEKLGFECPYVITEYGPTLPSDSQKDENGQPIELRDADKAKIYANLTSQIREFRGACLGGFVFHLGDTTQESLSWWNLNQSDAKRESYWKMRELYTGDKVPVPLPRVQSLQLSRTTLAPDEPFDAQIVLRDRGQGSLKFWFEMSTSQQNVLQHYVNQRIDPRATWLPSGTARLIAPSKEGIYRVYAFVRDEKGSLSSLNRTIRVEKR